MISEVTQAQIERYRTQGYLAIEGFLSPEELLQWRDSADRAVKNRLAAVKKGIESGSVKTTMGDRFRGPLKAMLGQKGIDNVRNGLRKILGRKLVPVGFSGTLNSNQGKPDSYYAKVYIQCIHLAAEDESLRKMVHDPRIGKVAAALAGCNGIRMYHDQALFKPPYGNPTAWHLDNPFWSFHSRQAMTMWVALDDATLANGCMNYIPTSHLSATYDKNLSIGDNFSGLFKMYPDWMKIDPTSAPCPAGSVVFHNGLTAHGAGVNVTNKPRRAYACALMPDGAVFNGNKDVLPNDYFKSLKIGDVLNNEQVHPLLWKEEVAGSSMAPPMGQHVFVGAPA
ncbi:MAG: phytanoyl-CoA dioxygenase family protein [Planctomycetota bacterium]|nr:phytanoyl-CoA dioxygenase family protein [Planctomycetota bacterium]